MSDNSFYRYYDNVLFHEQILGAPSTPVAPRYVVGEQYGGVDVSDWDYLVIDAKRFFAAGSNYLIIAVTWTTDMNTFAITTGLGVRGQWQSTEYFTLYAVGLPSQAEGFWCIPIKGQFVNVSISSLTPAVGDMFGNLMIGVMRGTRMVTRAKNNNLIMDYTAPGTATGVNFRSDAEVTALGEARIHGYVFNNSASGVTVAQLYEVTNTGALEEILYVQNPPGSPANSVQMFDTRIPLRGRALSFRGTVASGAIGNARISVSLFPQ